MKFKRILTLVLFQESSEEPDYDQVPLPSLPPLPLNQTITRQQHVASWDHCDQDTGVTHVQSNTVKRRAKRDRNNTRTTGPARVDICTAADKSVAPVANHFNYKRSKSRSKSRSPGRDIDRAAIVIVHHHTTCSHVTRDTCHQRTVSPDNLSESSISFHENEVNFDLSPGSISRGLNDTDGHAQCQDEPTLPEPPSAWYDGVPGHGGAMDSCITVCREPLVNKCDKNKARTVQYSNWESCRESWFSSGSSELRPSSGSDCPPPRPPSFSENLQTEQTDNVPKTHNSARKPAQLENNAKYSAPNTPHLKRTREVVSCSRDGSPTCATLPRSAAVCSLRQSSKDSGSSSSRPNSRPGTRQNTR